MGDIKMLFEFDEEKVKASSSLTVEEMRDRIFHKYEINNLKVEWRGEEIVILGGEHIYEKMLAIMGHLSRSDWFPPYIKRWEWIDDDGVDDIIEGYKELALKKPEREDLRKWLEK